MCNQSNYSLLCRKIIQGDDLMKLIVRLPRVCKAINKAKKMAALKNLKYKTYFDLFTLFFFLPHSSICVISYNAENNKYKEKALKLKFKKDLQIITSVFIYIYSHNFFLNQGCKMARSQYVQNHLSPNKLFESFH